MQGMNLKDRSCKCHINVMHCHATPHSQPQCIVNLVWFVQMSVAKDLCGVDRASCSIVNA